MSSMDYELWELLYEHMNKLCLLQFTIYNLQSAAIYFVQCVVPYIIYTIPGEYRIECASLILSVCSFFVFRFSWLRHENFIIKIERKAHIKMHIKMTQTACKQRSTMSSCVEYSKITFNDIYDWTNRLFSLLLLLLLMCTTKAADFFFAY